MSENFRTGEPEPKRWFGSRSYIEARYVRVMASAQYAKFFQPGADDMRAQKLRKRIRRPTLRQALKQASKAGMAVSGATVKPDGSVELAFGSAKAGQPNGHDIETAEDLRGLI